MISSLRTTFLLLSCTLLFSQTLFSQHRILLDESLNDWQNIIPAWTANGSSEGVSLEAVKVTNDEDFLFIYFESEEVYSLQNQAGIKLYLDSDNRASSGFSKNNIGADIVINFGQRNGTAYLNNTVYSIGFADLFLITTPTVDSDFFEIAIRRDAVIRGAEVFTSDEIKLIIADESAGDGASSDAISYTFSDGTLPPLPEYSFTKKSTGHLRVTSHNVEFDGFFEESNKDEFDRLYDVIEPDIIGFSEIYNHTPADVTNRLEEMLPSPSGQNWKAARIQDNFVATRFTIKNSWAPSGFGNGVFLLDLRPQYDTDALVVVAHPPCCDNDAARQDEIDAFMSFIREAKQPGGEVTLNDSTPIIIMGDMNLVGDPQQVTTMLTGDIVNESTYGNDFTPDWGGNDFLDAKPFVTGLPMTFTQGIGTSPGSFSKGRLDYVIYSGSVLELQNAYVLYTDALEQHVLDSNGLLAGDTESASDHFPVVVDFQVSGSSADSYTIASTRQNNGEGVPELQGSVITVNGTVTVGQEFGTNGPAFIQSGGTGVAIYGEELISGLHIGDNVTISSPIGFYNGLTEFVYEEGSSSVSINGSGQSPLPASVTIDQILNQNWDGYEQYEGLLVEITGVVAQATGTFESGQNYQISDGENSMQLRVNYSVDLSSVEIPEGEFSVIGVISQYDDSSPYSDGYQIHPRFAEDIKEVESNVKTIAEVRENDGEGIPEMLNEIITVSGIVTTDAEFGDSGPRYIQDETGGMAIYGDEFSGQFSTGDSITITGELVQYAGLAELVYDEENTSIEVHKSGFTVQPKLVTIADILNQSWDGVEEYEGVLVKVENASIAQTGNFEGNTNYILSDPTGEMTIRIDRDTDLVGEPIPAGEFSVDAVIGQYDNSAPHSEGYQLMPRKSGDITEVPLVKSIELLKPEAGTEFTAGEFVTISWSAENINLVHLLYISLDSDAETMIAENVDASLREYTAWEAPVGIDSLRIKVRDADTGEAEAQSGIIYIADAVSIEETPIPDSYTLYHNYPNPFNPATNITYSIPEAGEVELAVFDMLGRRIETLVNGQQSAGMYTISFDGAGLASGVYIYRLVAGGTSITHKMILNK